MAQGFVQTLIDGARWHCSFNSLKATADIEEGQSGIIVPDEAIAWSGRRRHCLGHCGGHRPLLLTCAEGRAMQKHRSHLMLNDMDWDMAGALGACWPH